MKIINDTIMSLKLLAPDELIVVNEMVHSMRKSNPRSAIKRKISAYTKVKKALSRCKGRLSDDIISQRADRL